jgi:hypothetical protein
MVHEDGIRVEVPALNFSEYLARNFLPEDTVIVRCDIEGAEYEVLKSLIVTGTARLVDYIDVEWHAMLSPSLHHMKQVCLIITICPLCARVLVAVQGVTLCGTGRHCAAMAPAGLWHSSEGKPPTPLSSSPHLAVTAYSPFLLAPPCRDCLLPFPPRPTLAVTAYSPFLLAPPCRDTPRPTLP